jgi:hypothetical protein
MDANLTSGYRRSPVDQANWTAGAAGSRVNGLFMDSRHAADMAYRRRAAMSIVQSGLPLALAMPFILAAWIWIVFLHRQRATACQAGPYAPVEAGGVDPVDDGLVAASVDLEAALRDAVLVVEAVARSRWVRMELAVGPAIPVPMDPSTLRMALRDIMLTAINAAPGGQVLVAAATLGRELHIRITDDGSGADQQVRETSMRQTEALVALQGGSLAIEAQPSRGTTVTIRLPMPAAAQREASGSMQLPVLADQAA